MKLTLDLIFPSYFREVIPYIFIPCQGFYDLVMTMECRVALNMKDISEDFTDTVNVDFVDVPVFEERLGFYKTYRVREQATPIVHHWCWI